MQTLSGNDKQHLLFRVVKGAVQTPDAQDVAPDAKERRQDEERYQGEYTAPSL